MCHSVLARWRGELPLRLQLIHVFLESPPGLLLLLQSLLKGSCKIKFTIKLINLLIFIMIHICYLDSFI